MHLDIQNKNHIPTFDEITNYMKSENKNRWLNLNRFIVDEFKSKSAFSYSSCSAKPGWNIKYKKSSKALCTLYPDRDVFTVLVVLNQSQMQLLNESKNLYTDYFVNIYDNCSLFNGTKWLMIDIVSNDVLNDVKNLIKLKTQ
jgi:hypothetical protein